MKEIEREGIPVAIITALPVVAKQIGANRVVSGTKIPHPCGDPNLPPKDDRTIRKEIVKMAFEVLQKDIEGPTIFTADVKFTSG